MTEPQLPGSPAWLRPGTPTLATTLLNLGYTTGQFGKNHLGDHAESLPTAQGFQEYWGYLYHLDAMQQVSVPDINKSPTEQAIAPPALNTPIPGLTPPEGSVDIKTTISMIPPRPVLSCTSIDGTQANQKVTSAGPLTLERSKTVDEDISAVRYKNWKMYDSMAGPGADGWLYPLINYAWPQVQNIKRDPFEQAVGSDV